MYSDFLKSLKKNSTELQQEQLMNSLLSHLLRKKEQGEWSHLTPQMVNKWSSTLDKIEGQLEDIAGNLRTLESEVSRADCEPLDDLLSSVLGSLGTAVGELAGQSDVLDEIRREL